MSTIAQAEVLDGAGGVVEALGAVGEVAIAQNEPLAAATHHERVQPHRYTTILTSVGRIAALSLPFALVALLTNFPPAVPTLIAVAAAWGLVMRGARTILPPAARLGSVSGAAIGLIVALSATILGTVLLGDLGVPTSELLLIALGVLVLSTAFEGWARRWQPPVRVLVVGGDSGDIELVQSLSNGSNPKCSLVTLVGDGGLSIDGVCTQDLEEFVVRERPDLVVLTEREGRYEALDRLLKVPFPSFRVVSFDHFLEWTFGRVSVWDVSPSWFMSLLHAYSRPYSRLTQRALDVSLACLALLVMLPTMLVIALLVRRSGRGRVLYRQLRVGEGGAPFEILKFRTMTIGAEADGNATWAGESDPRVTRIGRSLRKYRFDELPQLWNVLRGEMSIVGPRPERPEFVAVLEHDIPHWSRRLLVKPGLTGWAQICNGYTADLSGAADKLAYDLYYIKHRSLLLDLTIVLRTAGVVLRGAGAR
jgi:exopolysaccharide biosynthesis polyprenyl glycosylphosphotransferase